MATGSGKKVPPSSNGRNGAGKFVKGNSGGPGNPQAKALAAFRTRWLDVAKVEHIDEAYEWLYRAWSGDEFPPNVRVKAFELFLNRTIGKPKEIVELSGTIDADEMRERLIAHLRGGAPN